MTTLSLTSSLKDDILVVGLAQGPAARKGGKPSLVIESGDLALDAKSLEEILTDMGLCCGKAFRISLKTRNGNFNLFSKLPPNSSVRIFDKGDRKEASKNP